MTSQFNNLINALRNNQQVLEQQSGRGGIRLSGIDPIQAINASQVAMEQIAQNLRRSANVGIGFAFSAKYISENIALLKANNCM